MYPVKCSITYYGDSFDREKREYVNRGEFLENDCNFQFSITIQSKLKINGSNNNNIAPATNDKQKWKKK